MHLRYLKIQNLKLLRDFELDLRGEEAPQLWLAFVGENGLCKTSLLRAIAMAASGYGRSNQLAEVPSLLDRRNPEQDMHIRAEFGFSKRPKELPGLPQGVTADEVDGFTSELILSAPKQGGRGSSTLHGASHYLDASGNRLRPSPERAQKPKSPDEVVFDESAFDTEAYSAGPPLDPIATARDQNTPEWFVAGYGTSRKIPSPGVQHNISDAALSRLYTLFDRGALVATGFADQFDWSNNFAKALQSVFVDQHLLPNVSDLELRGRGGIRNAADLVESERFSMSFGGKSVKVPATWLSHGYQGTIAWVSDLIGHLMLEVDGKADLKDMHGIVLVDEIDLHLHPQWQRTLIRVLRTAFPNLQFIVTTHSPLVLPGLQNSEVHVLEHDSDGSVHLSTRDESPIPLMTSSALLRSFFGIEHAHPDDLGRAMSRYSFLSGLGERSAEENLECLELQQKLRVAGLGDWLPELSPNPGASTNEAPSSTPAQPSLQTKQTDETEGQE